MSVDAELLCSLVGSGCALWAGEEGITVEAGGWSAFSGEAAVDYNLALRRRPDGVVEARDEILRLDRPAILMLAGAALGEAQMLVSSTWACIGAVSLMSRPLEGLGEGGDARILAPEEWDLARGVVSAGFDIPHALARLGLPDSGLSLPGRSVWGVFAGDGSVAACVATILVDDSVCLWSVATDPAVRGQGYGATVVEAALRGAAEAGARRAVVQAAAGAEDFYAARGFATVESWQQWSRPRWVLGRA